jgi:peptide/nickel transport system permease protein
MNELSNRIRIIRKFRRSPLAMIGIVILALNCFIAVSYDVIAPYAYNANDYSNAYSSPSLVHPFGTDELGRDVLSRVMYGSRIAVIVGIIAVLIALVTGVFLGLISGYFRGWADTIITYILDAIWAFPTLILALAITAVLGPGLRNVVIAIGVVYIPGFARIVRNMVLSIREMEYVKGARAIGLNSFEIITRYILPNVFPTIIVQASLNAAQAILAEATLSFLGLGILPPAASWGTMLKTSYSYLSFAPWMSIYPGIAIFIAILGLNFLGDGLRDALDVKIRAE